MRKTWLRAGRVVIVAVVAVVLFVVVLPTSRVDDGLMANLMIRDSHVSVLKAKAMTAKVVPVAKSPVPIVTRIAARHASETGVYESEWTGPKSSANDGGLLLMVVPNVADAKTTLTATNGDESLVTPPNAQGAASHFTVPGVAATGSQYNIAVPSHPGHAYTVTFRVGRAVVIELLEVAGTSASPAAAQSMARQEATLLQGRVASFSFLQSTRPLLGVLLVVIGGLLLAGAAFFGPEWWAHRRVTREVHAQKRARSQYASRGRRAVTRSQAPAWRQHKRR